MTCRTRSLLAGAFYLQEALFIEIILLDPKTKRISQVGEGHGELGSVLPILLLTLFYSKHQVPL